jgi:hypothetical protein
MRFALYIANMAKRGILRATVEEMQQLLKKHWAEVQQEK